MFGNKIIKKIKLENLEPDIIELSDDMNTIDFHQTILNIGYGWWNNKPNPNEFSYSDMIDYMDKTYGQIFGTLILIGKLNQQVNNGGFIQYYKNHYSRVNETDYEQSLHIRLVKDLTEIIGEIKEKDKLIDIAGFIILNEALGIFKDYLKVPIDLEETTEEEVEYGNETDGFFFEMEQVENDNYGTHCDPELLDDLDERYYRLDEKLMELLNIISKLCFESKEVPALKDEGTNQLILDAVEEFEDIETDPEEWDDEMTISDRIEAMIDPEMNIFKVREMFQEAYDLSNTKSESEYLIDQFVKNFDKEYFIVKRDK